MKSLRKLWKDYGESSLTLLAVHCGMDKETPHVPLDPSDFKRCVHLFECLDLDHEEILSLLSKTANKYSMWKPLSKNWDNLMILYNQEKYNASAPKLNKALHELNSGDLV